MAMSCGLWHSRPGGAGVLLGLADEAGPAEDVPAEDVPAEDVPADPVAGEAD